MDVKKWLNEMSIENYTINDNLTVDVDGDVSLFRKELKSIPVQFGVVNGDFNCAVNQLKSLLGCPKIVVGDFYCYKNKITSLVMAPEKVYGSFDCGSNKLTSLKGCPKVIKTDFSCPDNNLLSLNDGPEEVGGSFSCYSNKLTSLDGIPREISGTLNCAHNFLNSFKNFLVSVHRINFFNNKINYEELINFNTRILENELNSDFGNYEKFIGEVELLKNIEEGEWLLKQTCSFNNEKNTHRRKY